MKRYSEYKDSGVKWIGEIPGHWDTPRIKSVAIFNPSKSTVNYQKVGYAPMDCIRCGNITAGIIDYKKLPTGLTYFENEDIVVAKVTPCFENGNIAIAKNLHNGCAYGSSELFVFRCYGVENRYLFYYMQDEKFKHKCCSTMTGTGGLKRISSSFIRNAFIPLPPLPEQEAIVTYLDTKVAKIDEYIAIAEKKIAALEELKQTIIAEAVTRGIHKDVPMKDSGVKWIGMIPEHWKIMRLRFVCEFRNGYTPSKANPKFWENGTIPWFRMEDIRDSGRFLNEAKQYISKEAVKGDGLFEAGSFILATTATIGEHAMLIADSLANQQFTNLKIRKSLISKLSRNFFFYYLFVIDEYCKSTTRKATFPSVDMTDLKNIGVSIPPIEEQQEIVTYLDSKVANINQLCQAERSQIEKLKEYKQRLISDVVTGKVKVTND